MRQKRFKKEFSFEILWSLNIVYIVSVPKERRKRKGKKGQGSKAQGKNTAFYSWAALYSIAALQLTSSVARNKLLNLSEP